MGTWGKVLKIWGYISMLYWPVGTSNAINNMSNDPIASISFLVGAISAPILLVILGKKLENKAKAREQQAKQENPVTPADIL